jgi:hypothetical protein
MSDHYGAQVRRQLEELRQQLSAARATIDGLQREALKAAARLRTAETELAEARSWARHGYEIGQRHCGWTDHGVAPAWLTDGWPPHIDTCQHLTALDAAEAELAELREGEEPYEDERVLPTPGQWIWLWNRATPAERLVRAEQAIADWQTARQAPFREERIEELSAGCGQLSWAVNLQRERAEHAEARIAAVRALAERGGIYVDGARRIIANQVLAALDGPAEQPAVPAQLSPASIAAPEPVRAPTWSAMTEMVERARFGFLVEQLRLEAAIVTAVQDAGLTIVRTGPVEEVAAHPGTVNRLKTVVLGCFERVGASVGGPLPGPVTRVTGLPVTADHSLPPGEVHLRPHPRPAGGPS